MTGIDKTQQGIEFGAEIKAMKSLSFVAVAAVGQYLITNRPQTTISYDNGSAPDTTAVTYLKNFYVYGTRRRHYQAESNTVTDTGILMCMQTIMTGNYMDLNPERRTQTAIQGLQEGDPKITTITQQQMLKGIFLDASLGKSIRISGKIFVYANFSISNIPQ